MSKLNLNKRVIVALDGIDRARALELAAELSAVVWGFKVNDLLVQYGVSILGDLKKFGAVFADAKLHDIPNTVSNSVARLAGAGADLITIHGSGGAKMIEAACKTRDQAKILAVTILTSIDDPTARSVYGVGPRDGVARLAGIAAGAGADGVVCSPEELGLFEAKELNGLIRVTPGIRPADYGKSDDQSRTMTPQAAIAAGASLLVIGRPITGENDPRRAAEAIERSISGN